MPSPRWRPRTSSATTRTSRSSQPPPPPPSSSTRPGARYRPLTTRAPGYPPRTVRPYTVQALANLDARARPLRTALQGDRLAPAGPPLTLFGQSPEQAASTAARTLSSQFPWSPYGLQPGDAILVAQHAHRWVYVLGLQGVLEAVVELTLDFYKSPRELAVSVARARFMFFK
jgi:hypothetical protein